MAEASPVQKEEDEKEKRFQGHPFTWKGFLSTTSPSDFELFATKDVKKVALGGQHTAFLTSDHSVYCIGSGEFGQLGHGKFTDVTKKPIRVQSLNGENVMDVVCGTNHTGVVCSDGIVFCWGDSSKGQCAVNDDKINTPQLVGISDKDSDPVITQISCGDYHTLALTNTGEVWAWGFGPQLGVGSGSNIVVTPTKIQALCGRKVLQISCGGTFSVAILQKIITSKSPSSKSNDTEDDGSGMCIECDEDAFSIHEEGDTLVVTDNHICVHDQRLAVPSLPNISPDSLDVSVIRKRQNANNDDTQSAGSADSQGTYTLEEEEENQNQSDNTETKTSDSVNLQRLRPSQEALVFNGLDEDDLSDLPDTSENRLPFNKSAKQFLVKQLRPLQLVVDSQFQRQLSTREKMLNFVPKMLVAGIEKLINPSNAFFGNLRAIMSPSDGKSKTCQSESMRAEMSSPLVSPYDDIFNDAPMLTEIWSWGKGTHGQLGQGDTLERPSPTIIKQLTGKNVISIVAGQAHSIAVASNGQAFSWGSNSDGQLGHAGQMVPKRIKMPGNALVWGAAVGSTHTLLLADGTNFQPDVYYLGKQPSLQELRNEGRAPESPMKEGKDSTPKKRPTSAISKSPTVKYAARAKQPEKLAFLRKCGWVQMVAASGDACACIADKNTTGFAAVLNEFSATERLLHSQLSIIKSTVLKSLQSADTLKILENSIYLHPLHRMIDLYSTVSSAVGRNSVQLTSFTGRSYHIMELLILQNAKEFTSVFEMYARSVFDFVNLSGFKQVGKLSSEILLKHDPIFMEMLSIEKPQEYGPPLRRLLQLPLDRVKSYAYLLSKLKEYFPQVSEERKAVEESYTLWENVKSTTEKCLTDAEGTKAFWDSCPTKLAESLKRPDRRLIKDSRNIPLHLANAGRLSSHWFLLFSDVFVHAQGKDQSGIRPPSGESPVRKFTSHHVYSLSLVWAEPIPDTDQTKNGIQLTTPERSFVLHTNSPAEKAEWLWSINQSIDSILTAGKKEVSEIKSPNGRVPPKLARPGSHTFPNHPLGKDLRYEGMWLSGKPQGSGTLIWPDGKRYNGSLVQGLPNGFGWCVEPTQDGQDKCKVFQGQWRDGKMEGRGFLRYANGDVYLGNFKDSLRDGHGILQCVSPASIFVGQWKKDKICGYGVMDDSNRGEKFMGLWQDGCRHGDGLVITLEGVYYEGKFNQSKLTGSGILLSEDGTCFQGELASGPTLNGKGTLTFPNGDYIEGTFHGLWAEGVKIAGSFSKYSGEGPPPPLHRSLGQFTISADEKWQEIFDECATSLGCIGDKVDTRKAWNSVAACLALGKRELDFLEELQSDIDAVSMRKAIEELETIPNFRRSKVSSDDLKEIENYLQKAFDLPIHPIGRMVENLVNVFRASYVGLGAHQLLLPYAIEEVKMFVKRTYETIRILFPELPNFQPKPRTPVQESTPSEYQYYYDYTNGEVASASPVHLQEKHTTDDDNKEDISQQITPEGLLHPLLLPKLCPALFTIYAVKNADENDRYLDRLNRLNRQPDMSLMAYLGVDSKFWLIEDKVFETPSKLKEVKDVTYVEAIQCLERITTSFSPADKLRVIEATMEAIDSQVQKDLTKSYVWSMDDLFPVFQYVVIRARVSHLGAEIQLIEDLMDPVHINGRLGILLTTLKACYVQIKNENLKAL